MRFGANKALYPLRGKPILLWSLEKFSKLVDEVVVTYSKEEERSFVSAISSFHNVKLISGGETRFDSVRKGFDSISDEGIVLIHDAARPVVSTNLIEIILQSLEHNRAVIPVIPVTDTVKEVNADRIVRTIERQRLGLAQTPQGFHTSVLADAYARVQNREVTDEAMLIELAGIEVFFVLGETSNLKITEPSDIALAEFYLREKEY